MYHVGVRPDARRGAAASCPALDVLIQVADESGDELLPGAVWYEEALAAASPRCRPTYPVARRPLHPLHGRHDRHAEGRAVAAGGHLRGGDRAAVGPTRARSRPIEELASRRPARRAGSAVLPAPPFMHGAAHWIALHSLAPRATPWSSRASRERLDPVRHLVARSSARRLRLLLIVGDAFARPLLDELERSTLRPLVAHRVAVGRRACSPLR